jgi:hypothetical protein
MTQICILPLKGTEEIPRRGLSRVTQIRIIRGNPGREILLLIRVIRGNPGREILLLIRVIRGNPRRKFPLCFAAN